jgi:hypothetical protein
MTKHDSIMANRKVIGKPMSYKQLEYILKLIAQYDINLPQLGTYLTVQEASNIITHIKEVMPQKRIKPYNPDDLMEAFINKYPEAYSNIINRDF